jgi:DNA-binding MarR family transcriptional regulator
MDMDEVVLNQARDLHKTLHMLKNHVLRRHAASGGSNNGSTCFDLTLPQANTLSTIRDARQMTVKEVAEATSVSAPSASAMIDRLVEMGLVVREHSQVDRREVFVRLSPDGTHAVDRMEEEILGYMTDLMERVGPSWTQKWCDVYRRLREVLSEDSERESQQPVNSKREK